MKVMSSSRFRRLAAAACCLLLPLVCSASGVGTPDYSQGADALHDAFIELEKLMWYTFRICTTVAAILSVISATQIYVKMNNGDDGVMKSIHMLFWSVIFLLAAGAVFPAFFGFSEFNPGALSGLGF